MIRIINGHYSDPTSTRDIIGISPKEWHLFSQELTVFNEYCDSIMAVDFNNTIKAVEQAIESIKKGDIKSEIAQTHLSAEGVESILSSFKDPSFENTFKQSVNSQKELIKSIFEKHEYVSSNESCQISGISADEYGLLISVIQQLYMVHKGVVDNFNHKAIDIATKINKELLGGVDYFRNHPDLRDIKDKADYQLAKLELCEKMTGVCFGWLIALNQPYDGAEY